MAISTTSLRRRRDPPVASWPTAFRAIPQNRVLILEAGGKDDWIWFHIRSVTCSPSATRAPIGCSRPKKRAGLNGRAIKYPRGKVIGGIVGHQRHDLDARTGGRLRSLAPARPERLGVPTMSSRPFRSLDDHFLGDTDHHGAGGEWRVEAPRLQWDVLGRIATAATEMGIAATPDFNTGDNAGVGVFHVNQKRGMRWSSARGFLKPALKRPNLRLETGVMVERGLV